VRPAGADPCTSQTCSGDLGGERIVGGSPPLVIGAALTAETLTSDRRRRWLSPAMAAAMQERSSMRLIWRWSCELPAILLIENNGYWECPPRSIAVGARTRRGRSRIRILLEGTQRCLPGLRGNGRCSDLVRELRRPEFIEAQLRPHPRTLLRRSADLPLQRWI